jgi:glycosyltransferase involved in cell wall biosynthesis
MQFSLILPVYGVEQYIEKCLRSCLEQKDFEVGDYEIIIVDDSSKDNSIAIAKDVIAQYPKNQVKIVTRPNGGLSAARNTGIDNAQGDYLWFIDSDDWIESDSLHILSEALTSRQNVEILSFCHNTVYGNKTVVGSMPRSSQDRTMSGLDYFVTRPFLSAWSRIYSRKFVTSYALRFAEGILWEDSEFNLRAFGEAKKCSCVNAALYNYLRRPNSISTSNSVKRTLDSDLYRIESAYSFYEKRELKKEHRRAINRFIAEIAIFLSAGNHQLLIEDKRHYRSELRKRKNIINIVIRNCGSLITATAAWMTLYFPYIAEPILYKRLQRAMNCNYSADI